MTLTKIRCIILGHKWKYNFKYMPSRAICVGCCIKAKFNILTLKWEAIEKFEGDNRTDSELIKKWI